MRSGSEYLQSLDDDRAIFLDGERIGSVASHPAFEQPIRVIADTYDAQRDDPGEAWRDPESGETFAGMWRIPRSADDLAAKRRTHELWSRPNFGLMGRTPDHLACLLAAFAANRELFASVDPRFGDNVVRFYERARREDLYLAYVIVPPQVDRTKPAHQQPEPFLYAGVKEERDDGVVIRGAQMIGTSAVMADYVLLTYIVPLVPGDEDYAISAVVPVDAEGLRIYPRRPYSTIAQTPFDYPLSSRFDEVDSLVVFDDVLVPWENVFAYRDLELLQAQFHRTGGHLLANFQALCRFVVKLKFAAGLAMRLAELHGVDKIPPVQGQLGHGVATIASSIEAQVVAAQHEPLIRDGLAWPNPKHIYTGLSLQRQQVIELNKWLRELAGGAFIAVPSSEASFESAATAADTERYYRSANASARERVRLLKLIWDFVGTEFAGRQLQYEMFYVAAQHISDARVYQHFDWQTGLEMVDECLSLEAGETERAQVR
jgi:4-hydroxyphenylacetate 3-monooxygenase